MSKVNQAKGLSANPDQAKVIHQNGTLIFADIAAAQLFGFDTVSEFVTFAKTASLFAPNRNQNSKSRARILNFRCFKGNKKRAHVLEKLIVWRGTSSWSLTLTQLPTIVETETDQKTPTNQNYEEAYLPDSFAAAIDWSRTDSDTLDVINAPFDFPGVCMQLCDDLKDYADSKNVVVNIEIKPRAQKIFYGDCAKMARAATCLVRYAIDQTPKGRVDVTLRAGEAGEHVMLEISDFGASYTPSDANILFDANKTHDRAAASTDLSSSLDLPLARCIARFLGGEVALKINHLTGGLVRMRLPFQEIKKDNLFVRTNGQSHIRLNILVVEDNLTSQHIIKVILSALGHRATIVSNGKECIDILLQASFDVIFMDLHMPIQDGYSATEEIRTSEKSGILHFDRAVPILAITADNRPETRERALKCGVTGFLTKPVHIPQIMAALAPFVEDVVYPLTGQSNPGELSQVA